MSLVDKLKSKISDHPNSVSGGHPHKPSSGDMDVNNGTDPTKLDHQNRIQKGQGGEHPDDLNYRAGSLTSPDTSTSMDVINAAQKNV